MTRLHKSIIIIFLILFVDQFIKIWVKTHMFLGQEYKILGDWFIIHFTENNGMAFGFELGGEFGKIALSIFRIIAVSGIGYYIYYLYKKKASFALMLSISLVFAGALGNIIDSAFYGLIFDASYYQVAEMFPKDGGYATFLHGKVVDMFYFPVFRGYFPDWFPFWENESFIFFRPVFNIADASISVGVATIVLFQRSFFKSIDTKSEEISE